MDKCLICGAEYELPRNGRMACGACFDKVQDTQPRYLTLEQRLWGRCYKVGGCWEYGQAKTSGRPSYIMADRRQVPPSHIALHLDGRPRPSLLYAAKHKHGANPMCVNPAHLEWVEELARRGSIWAQTMTADQLLRYEEIKRATRARHQRTYRRKLADMGGAPSVRAARNERDMMAARAMVHEGAGREPVPLVPLGENSPGAQIRREREAAEAAAKAKAAEMAKALEERHARSIANAERILASEAHAREITAPKKKRGPAVHLWEHGLDAGPASEPEKPAPPLVKPAPSMLDALLGARIDATE